MSILQVERVACITLAPDRIRSCASARPSAATSRLDSTTRAPTVSGRNNSRPAMSKARGVIASSTAASDNPGASRIDTRKLVNARCGTATPLGRPVEPEVKIT